jgi:hypothetical protein
VGIKIVSSDNKSEELKKKQIIEVPLSPFTLASLWETPFHRWYGPYFKSTFTIF